MLPCIAVRAARHPLVLRFVPDPRPQDLTMKKKGQLRRRQIGVRVYLSRLELRQLRQAAAEDGDSDSCYGRRAILRALREWLEAHPDQCNPGNGRQAVLAGS
jgi:hypothetical protein